MVKRFGPFDQTDIQSTAQGYCNYVTFLDRRSGMVRGGSTPAGHREVGLLGHFAIFGMFVPKINTLIQNLWN